MAKFFKSVIFLALMNLFLLNANAQVSIPYINTFNNFTDTIGWSHYAINGTDDWSYGQLNNPIGVNGLTNNFKWATRLNIYCADSSERVLESPYFNLTDTAHQYILGFTHFLDVGMHAKVEYKINSSGIWTQLNFNVIKNFNWQTSEFLQTNTFFTSTGIRLDSIVGNDSVKFRFRVSNLLHSNAGWIIDNFNIKIYEKNIYPTVTDTAIIALGCTGLSVNIKSKLFADFNTPLSLVTNLYLSNDTIFDNSDTYLVLNSNYWYSTQYNMSLNFNKTISLPTSLSLGFHYIIYKLDINNSYIETNENDNIGYAVINVVAGTNLPNIEDFESSSNSWVIPNNVVGTNCLIRKGFGYVLDLTPPHSGNYSCNYSHYAFSTGNSNCGGANQNYLHSKNFNFNSLPGNKIINYWTKSTRYNLAQTSISNLPSLYYSLDCGMTLIPINTLDNNKKLGWNFHNLDLSQISSDTSVSLHFEFGYNDVALDDIYIGLPKADLSIENIEERYTKSTNTSDTLKYQIVNSGIVNAASTNTLFYWSNDSILDANDFLLGTKTEPIINDTTRLWTSFIYNKQNTNSGKYYIFYILDSSNVVDEMRDNNNTGYFTIYQSNALIAPYFNNFETQINDWRTTTIGGKNNLKWMSPPLSYTDTNITGQKCWVVDDTANISHFYTNYLYSPIFDCSGIVKPVIDFDEISKFGENYYRQTFDTDIPLSLEYSIDGGAIWEKIEYDSTPSPYRNKQIIGYNLFYGLSTHRNTRFNTFISQLEGVSEVQIRFKFMFQYNGDYNIDTPIIPQNANPYYLYNTVIDNFSLNNGMADLCVKDKKSLMLSSVSNKIKFNMDIKNKGNLTANEGYNSTPTITNKFYLSSDSIFSSTDYYLGTNNINYLPSDFFNPKQYEFNSPSNLSSYNYLIYTLDVNNIISESDESNNIGFWPLALDSLNNTSYFNNFNDSVIDGWYYSDEYLNSNNINFLGFRHLKLPLEPIDTVIKSGQWFLNVRKDFNPNTCPNDVKFLQSPSFNFSGSSNIKVSFQFACNGDWAGSINGVCDDGGNMSYSIDGGNTWSLLDNRSSHNTINWYNRQDIINLNHQPGWVSNGNIVLYTSTLANNLRNKTNVVFRFNSNSCFDHYNNFTYSPAMIIDNFKVDLFNIDLKSLDSLITIVNGSYPGVSVNYHVKNNSPHTSPAVSMRYYLSTDSIFDANDIYAGEQITDTIAANAIKNSYFSLIFPNTLTQSSYYLFYKLNPINELTETDTTNNIGRYKLNISPFVNYKFVNYQDTVQAFIQQNSDTISYSILNAAPMNGGNSATRFYWSSDSVYFQLFANEVLTKAETPINAYNTETTTAVIPYPNIKNREFYYLYSKLDINDVINESNENDNFRRTVVHFTNFSGTKEVTTEESGLYVAFGDNQLIIKIDEYLENDYDIQFVDILGQKTHLGQYHLTKGLTNIDIRKNISDGLYFLTLTNKSKKYTKKIVITKK